MAMKQIIVQIIWILSELEALFVSPNSTLRFRRLFLRMMEIPCPASLWIGKSFHLLQKNHLFLGERCALGAFVRIDNHAPIHIGDDFLAAPGLCINSGSHDPCTLEPMCRPIHIGNRVWCGLNVTIMSGVTIGDDVVIGTGSLVADDVPSNTIVAGVPAKVIKTLDRQDVLKLWTWAK